MPEVGGVGAAVQIDPAILGHAQLPRLRTLAMSTAADWSTSMMALRYFG
jgi:hypothetical protein